MICIYECEYNACWCVCRLVGTPVGHTGIKTSKKIVCSIYADREDLERARERRKAVGERLQLQVIFVNAILDHVEVRFEWKVTNNVIEVERRICFHRFILLVCSHSWKLLTNIWCLCSDGTSVALALSGLCIYIPRYWTGQWYQKAMLALSATFHYYAMATIKTWRSQFWPIWMKGGGHWTPRCACMDNCVQLSRMLNGLEMSTFQMKRCLQYIMDCWSANCNRPLSCCCV